MPDVVRLSDVADIITGFPFKSALFTEEPSDIRLLRGDNIGQGRLRWEGLKRWPLHDKIGLAKYLLREGDVVLAMDRPWVEAGLKFAEVRSEDLPSLLVQRVALLRANVPLIQRFLVYLIGSPAFTGYVLGMQTGTAVPHISGRQIADFTFMLPLKEQQSGIAAVLGALDDKIAVNDRIARTSRELGEALYRSALNKSGREASIGDMTVLLARGQTPKYTEGPTGVTVLNQKCVRDGRILLGPARRTEADRIRSDRFLRKYDILVNSTGVGTLGRVGVWSHETPATVDSHVTILRIGESFPAIIGAFALLATQPEIETLGEGSTGQTELARAKLASLKVRIPDCKTDELAARLSALEERADRALNESIILTKLRDTLLPGLMSGRLRVRDAEKVVEESV